MTDKLTDNDRQRIEQEIDKGLIARGEHPTRVRNPLYGEERELAMRIAEYATLYERDKRKLWNDENNNLIKELGRRDGRIQQLEAERTELRNKVIARLHVVNGLMQKMKSTLYWEERKEEKDFLNELLNSLKTK